MKIKYRIQPYTPRGETKIKNQINYLQNKKQEWVRTFELLFAFLILVTGFTIAHVSDGGDLFSENYILKFNNSYSNYSENNFSIIIPELESGLIEPSEKIPNYKKIANYLSSSFLFILALVVLVFGMIVSSLMFCEYDKEINRLYLNLSGVKNVSRV